MAAATVDTNINTPSSDWPDRYFHVDQILDRPGPRTDPSFQAGDGVRNAILTLTQILRFPRSGQEISAWRMQNTRHWRWWFRLRNSIKSRVIGIQRHPRHWHGHHWYQQFKSTVSIQVSMPFCMITIFWWRAIDKRTWGNQKRLWLQSLSWSEFPASRSHRTCPFL